VLHLLRLVALEILAQVASASLPAQHLEVEVLLGVPHQAALEVLAQVVSASLLAQRLEAGVRLEEVVAG
jgi:hypothetical protein